MADLRALCEGLGYGDVKTLLNSGNVVFSAPRADAKAAAKIQKEIVRENPFDEGETNPSRFLATVLADAAARARVGALAKQDWGSEKLGVGTHAAYLWCPQLGDDHEAPRADARVSGNTHDVSRSPANVADATRAASASTAAPMNSAPSAA